MAEILTKMKDGGGTEQVPITTSYGIQLVQVTGFDGTIVSVTNGAQNVGGDTANGVTDAGNPVKVGGVARTTNPTAVTNGQRVNSSYDKLGRQLVVPYQMRELVSTAYLSLATNTETTLLAGIAGTFLDLYEITCANTSTAVLGAATSIQIDLRDATGGGVVHSFMINDDVSSSVTFNPPIPQNTAAGTWTAQIANGDISNTTMKISALFVQNT